MAPPPAKGNPLNGHEQKRASGAEDIRRSIDALNSMLDRIRHFRAEKGPAYPVSSA